MQAKFWTPAELNIQAFGCFACLDFLCQMNGLTIQCFIAGNNF
jgi:hypothetical protein